MARQMIRKPALLAVNALLAAALAAASLSAGAATAPAGGEAAVAQASEQLRAALVSGDAATLTKLTEPQLSYGHSAGKIEDRAEFMKDLVGTHAFKSVTLSDQTVKVVGDNAIVRHVFDSENNQPDGSVTRSHIGVLQVWKHHRDGWRLLARQAVPLPQKAAQ
ncbi:nuclear transport factor 2 family protein [Burkholderia sp. Ac-20379]|uniref:nuclear transport factor 2 family protein n=1 Tax=Burkholderia sp. Ac-20379 TaxID=2703900 RepID=UPI001F11C115|nr:nuclear transport factor 2 family protein [Burkholderia sp. Ac-20379]